MHIVTILIASNSRSCHWILGFLCGMHPVPLQIQASIDSRRYVLGADETGAPPQQPAPATSSPIGSVSKIQRTPKRLNRVACNYPVRLA